MSQLQWHHIDSFKSAMMKALMPQRIIVQIQVCWVGVGGGSEIMDSIEIFFCFFGEVGNDVN